jgi:tetratricopeptide (TPR) repeat protein
MSKSDIEKCLSSKGNFIKIDYLTKFLKGDIPMDVKKFAYLKLAETYESMRLFADAAQIFQNLSSLSLNINEKRRNFLQSAKFYILAGEFVKADELIRRAMSHANLSDKVIIYDDIKKFCKNVAQDYEKELKRNHASKIYEKILEMRISDSERKEIKERLNEIYEKLGKKVSEI